MTTLYTILICCSTSLWPWFIILVKNNFIKVSHHYWILKWAPMHTIFEWQCGVWFFSSKYSRRPHKSSSFPYKQGNGRNGDHQWHKMTNSYYVIYYEMLRKVMQRTEKEASRWRPWQHRLCTRWCFVGLFQVVNSTHFDSLLFTILEWRSGMCTIKFIIVDALTYLILLLSIILWYPMSIYVFGGKAKHQIK